MPFIGGLPSTGTIARTVTNIKSGAVSPVAGMVHSITLLIIVLVAAPLASNVPLACLSAILLFMAFNMGNWHEFIRLRQFTMSYKATLLATFFPNSHLRLDRCRRSWSDDSCSVLPLQNEHPDARASSASAV